MGTTYTESTIEDLLEQTPGSCDELFTLSLEVTPAEEFTFDRRICQGLEFTYGGGVITATETGSYTELIVTPGACDSIVTINLTVDEPVAQLTEQVICQGDSFEWMGTTYTESTNDAMLLETPGACNELFTLSLEVTEAVEFTFDRMICQGMEFTYGGGAITATETGSYTELIVTPGACDSIVTINLTVDEPVAQLTEQVICQGDSFEWMGTTYTANANETMLVETAGSCDELFELSLEVTPAELISENVVLCPSELPFEFGELKETESGVYSTVVNNGDCDVEYEFALTVLENPTMVMDRVLCAGETIVVNGMEIDSAGSFDFMVPNATGCDSIITVNVLASSPMSTRIPVVICAGESYVYEGTSIETPGDHEFMLQSVDGCDSLVTISLEIDSGIPVTFDEVICEGETFNLYDISATEEDVYTTVVESATSCDTLVTVNLRVLPKSSSNPSMELCAGESMDFHGQVLDTEGTYTAIIQNEAGCDSTITLSLAIIGGEEDTELVEQICVGQVYNFAGTPITESGTYTEVLTSFAGCDSTVHLDLTVMPMIEREDEVIICPGETFTYLDIETSEAGTFTTVASGEAGCDSILTFTVMVDQNVGGLVLPDSVTVNVGSTTDIIPEFIGPDLTNFEWSDENGDLLSTDSSLFAFSSDEDTWVELIALNENGCEISQRVLVKSDLVVDIFVPNVMQLEKENTDHYFRVGGNDSVVGIQELYIYDRWGELLFEDSHEGNLDSYLGWDGSFQNTKVLPGVYTYLVIFEIIDGSTIKKAGTVTVLD